MENEQVTPESQKIAIELMTAEGLKDAPIAELEGLLTILHIYANTLREKQQMVHGVLEAKQRAEVQAKEAEKVTSVEDVDAKIAALQNRKEALTKPPAQVLGGDHITKDAADVQNGQ